MREAGIECRTLHGGELDERMIDDVYGLHAETFARYGNAPYLNRDFFARLARALPDALVVEMASRHGVPIACAVSLRGDDTLYGRYWGASGDHHSLHFELCYYRGIEYCIREGLSRFEPGTQGEHKLLRGFIPTPVWSAARDRRCAFCRGHRRLARAGARAPPRLAARRRETPALPARGDPR